ncbi:MAG TPA: hypothetical protein VMJ34_14220 [Bryobacteraceae bacterium]|nr:hypothetical protein [Bryobacteraceae bacterium]
MATLAAIFDRLTLARSAAQTPARVDTADDFLVRPFANEHLYCFVKAIDNSGVVREADPRAGRACWKVIGTGMITTVVLLCLMLPSVLGLLAGYQLQSLRDERRDLETRIARAELEESRLLSPEQLDKIAKERDYAAPTPGHMVYLDNRDVSPNRLAKNAVSPATVAAQ